MRVIAGKLKGRRLKALEGQSTRPTSDMIKESIFNLIGPYFEAATVVDLFSGSGSLGIEALSRGVDHAYLVDHNPEATAIIRDNVHSLGLNDQVDILTMSAQAALHYFKSHGIVINLLLLDPPYDMEGLEELLADILSLDLISPRALVVCETSKRVELAEKIGSLEVIKNRKYGKSRVTVYQNTVELED